MDERSKVLMATLLGAVAGGVYGWLYMTEHGRRVRNQIEPKLDDFINEVRENVTEGTSALFLMSRGAVVDRVAEEVKGLDFEIIETNLPQEQEEKLREAFAV